MSINLMDYTEAYAVPGEENLIDIINPVTGLTAVYAETLEQIRERYPNAELVNIEEFCKRKAEGQDTPVTWSETTKERYWEMLECLPPTAHCSGGFLVGEPWDHHATSGQPRYAAFSEIGGKYYASSRPMTRGEFRKLFA
jgi:hypothetical protein